MALILILIYVALSAAVLLCLVSACMVAQSELD
jgi:hypothetical protein